MAMDPEDLWLLKSDRQTDVESHICQNRADMGHPSLVTDRNLTAGSDSITQGSVRNAG